MRQVRVRIKTHIWRHKAVLVCPDEDAVERLAAQIATAIERFTATKLHWEQVARIEGDVDRVLTKGGDHTLVLHDELTVSLYLVNT